MKLRVGHIVASGGFYGAERVILLLAKAQIEERLADPVVVSLEDSPETRQEVGLRAEREGIEVCYVPVSNIRFRHSSKLLAEALVERNIQLAHSHGYKALILGARACKVAGIPIITTNHGWDGPTWRVRLYQRWEARVMRSLPVVTAVSAAKARQIESSGVSPDRIRVIPNGVPCPLDRDEPDCLRQALGIARDIYVAGAVGRLIFGKGIDLLLEAMTCLRDRNVVIHLIVAGDGPMRQSLMEQAASRGLEERIAWLGFTEDTDAVYSACDVIVLPSRDEGMPMTLLEAMSHGKAIVATDVGGIGEVVEDGVNGRLVPPEDAGRLAKVLAEVLFDESQRVCLGQEARRTVEAHFSSRAMAMRYAEVYERVLGSGSQSVG